MDKYLTDSLKYLSGYDKESLDANVLYQINILNTRDYNTTQSELYKQLNHLYEKMRVLEDINAYLQLNIKNKIATSSALCESLLKEIEESRDNIKESTYYTIHIPIIPCESARDRDGSVVPAVMIFNQEAVTKRHVKRDMLYTMSANTQRKPYSNNPNSLKDDKPYRSYYIEEQAHADGITEELIFAFTQESPVNNIAITSTSTKPFDYQLHKGKDAINISDLNWKDAIMADKCTMILNTKTYKQTSYVCDMSRIATNALVMLDAEIHKTLTGEQTMQQADIDKLLGVTQAKADYQKYLDACESWYERRTAVAEQNIKNGRKDEVPEHIIVAAPLELGADAQTADGRIINQTIKTADLLTKIVEKCENEERTIYMYNSVDTIFPSYERYRYDYLNPENENYYGKN